MIHSLLKSFNNISKAKLKITSQANGIRVTSNESEVKYVKIYDVDITPEISLSLQDGGINFFADGEIQLCIHFLNESLDIVSKILVAPNQYQLIKLNGTERVLSVFLRVRKGDSIVHEIYSGSEVSRRSESQKDVKFNCDGFLNSGIEHPKETFFVLETVFCDIETKVSVLERYFSFLTAQINIFKNINNSSVFWVIHFSGDKLIYIEKARNLIDKLGLQRNVVINLYTHPEDGYSNKNEKHIDKILKPNVSYPVLRDKLFESALSLININNFRNVRRFVRGVLDDDDFLNPKIFSVLENICIKIEEETDLDEYVLFNKNILVSYFTCEGKVIVDEVKFKRSVSGCRFSVGKFNFSRHPFGISEDVKKINSMSELIIDISGLKGVDNFFSYNRHVNNLSNHTKNHHYEKLLSSFVFENHSEFIKHFIS